MCCARRRRASRARACWCAPTRIILAGRGKDVRNLIGRLAERAFVDGGDGEPGEVQAELRLIEPDGAIARKLHESLETRHGRI